jgi:hypothetical protein
MLSTSASVTVVVAGTFKNYCERLGIAFEALEPPWEVDRQAFWQASLNWQL